MVRPPRARAKRWREGMGFGGRPVRRGGRSCVVMWRPVRGAAGEVVDLRRSYGCVYDRPPRTSEERNVIDRLREQIQERLEQLAGEADRLRKALAALDPRSSEARRPASRPARKRQSTKPTATATKSAPARRAKHACDSLPSPDGARRDEGRRARRARRRRGDDRRRGGDQGRPRPPDRVDDAVEARQDRRSGEGRARLPAADVARRRLLAGEVAAGRRSCSRLGGRRYRRRVLPLGFRFDVDAVIVDGVAHRADCRGAAARPAAGCGRCPRGGVHQAERCPRECPSCRPPFETLLTYQLERSRRGARAADRRPFSEPSRSGAADPPQRRRSARRARRRARAVRARQARGRAAGRARRGRRRGGIAGTVAPRTAGPRTRPATAGSGAPGRSAPRPPQTMHLRPATAARWRSLAAIDAVRWSGLVLRNCFLARRRARRRIGVRFIVSPLKWCGSRPG